jgi:predicted dehydrogenase
MLGEGAIGKPIAGVCAMMTRGMEHRHPNPEFFFKPGGGPVLDIGPYYLSMLVLLLGPVQRVTAVGQSGFSERVVTAPDSPRLGDRIKVEVLTTVQGVLQFEMGAQISFSFSWDICNHAMAPLELYGSEGSMRLPDPNFFGGAIQIAHERCSWKTVDVDDQPFGLANFPEEAPTLANYRGLGLAEMANAIGAQRPHRANGEFGLHVLDALLSIEAAAISGHTVEVRSRVEQPELLADEQARILLASARA